MRGWRDIDEQCKDCKYVRKDGKFPCKAKVERWQWVNYCSFYKKKKTFKQRIKDIFTIHSPSKEFFNAYTRK